MTLAPSRSVPHRDRHAFRPSLSGLETRQVPAGSMSFSGGVLSLYADAGASVATLNSGPGATVVANIDGLVRTFTAAELKLVMFYANGGDTLINNTGETSLSDLAGTGNSVQGGTGTDFVVDYSGDADVDDLDGGMLYARAKPGVNGYALRISPTTGNVIVRLT